MLLSVTSQATCPEEEGGFFSVRKMRQKQEWRVRIFFFFHSLDFCRNEKDGETSVKSVRTEQSQCEECKPHETGVLAVVKKTA